MSREIKFRAWNKEEEKMLSNVAVQNGKQVWAEQAVGSDVWDAKLVAGNNIIMQFTGLKDKNGKEIYEGDIVSCQFLYPDNNCWETCSPIVVEWDRYGYDPFSVYGVPDYSFLVEVIGNIYENPELLNKREKKNDR